MATPLTLETTRADDGKFVMTAAGEIDLSNVDAFTRAITAAITEAASGGGALTVDLSAVEYLDSAAINVLFPRAEHIHLIANPLLMRVFAISGLTELASIEPAPPKAEH